MMTGPSQTAHERLADLARWRQRDRAAAAAGMPDAMRELLHREVARQSKAGFGVPEPVPIPAAVAWWRRWRAFAGLVVVGVGAVAILLAMVRSGLETSRRSGSSEKGLETARVGTATATDSGEAFSRKEPASAPLGLGSPASLATPVPAPVLVDVPTRLAADSVGESGVAAGKLVRTLDGAVRLRRSYVASPGSSSNPPSTVLLQRFEVVRLPDRLEFRDQDGSVYVGRVQEGVGSGGDGAWDWVFEGRGTHVPLGKVVLITGHFGPAPTPREARMDRLMDTPFTGTAVIGETNVVEIRAQPEP